MDEDIFKDEYATELKAAREDLRSMARKYYDLGDVDRPAGLLDSRIAGPVAWAPGEPLPEDTTGQAMVFAFQINLATLDPLPGFPASGLLQVFLANDVIERGITFFPEHREDGYFPLRNGDGFRLVFHPETDNLVETLYELPSAEFPVHTPDTLTRPHAIMTWDATEHFPPMTHWQGMQVYQRFEALPEAQDDLSGLHDVLSQEVWDEQLTTTFYLGGYACPLQLDQRAFFTEYQRYERCLVNFGELPGLNLFDMNFAILISDADLRAARFDDVVLIADTD